MKRATARSLKKIVKAIDYGESNTGWARRAAAAFLGLPPDAVWLYSPGLDRAARSDKKLGNLREEWKAAGNEFEAESMLH